MRCVSPVLGASMLTSEDSDELETRVFSGAHYTSDTAMSVNNCISFCDGKEMIYAGVGHGSDCYKILSDFEPGPSVSARVSSILGNASCPHLGVLADDPPFDYTTDCDTSFNQVTANASMSDCNMACTSVSLALYSWRLILNFSLCFLSHPLAAYVFPVSHALLSVPGLISGDKAQKCGAGHRINVYRNTAVPIGSNVGAEVDGPPVPASTPTSDEKAVVQALLAPGPVTSGLPGTWQYNGCYV